MLILKLTDSKRRAYGGFRWPESGLVECEGIWDPTPTCGPGGLYGWANGEGAYNHGFNEGCWLVVSVLDDLVVSVGGDKVKFPGGEVIYCGTRTGAVEVLKANGSLHSGSNPAWACLTPAQTVKVAMRSADRAVRKYAPKALRARGLVEAAKRLKALPKIVDRQTATAAAAAAVDVYAPAYSAAANAANAANAAANAANAADADAAYAAATNAAYAVAYAAYYAANEHELVRLDKLEMLGIPGDL